MSEDFAEAISDDDSSPEPELTPHHLLGDPATEGNEHLHLTDDSADEPVDDHVQDDLHFSLNSSDVQN